MDIASVVGLIAAFVLIVMAMGDPSVFIDVPSVLIVIGGTAATVLNTTTIPGLIGAIKVFLKSTALKNMKGKLLMNSCFLNNVKILCQMKVKRS